MSAPDGTRPVRNLGELLREQAQHVPTELLVRYHRREALSDGERIMIESHLTSCERCRAHLRLQQRFEAETRAATAPREDAQRRAPPGRSTTRLRAVLRHPALGWAAAATLALVLFGRGSDEDGRGVLMGGEPRRYELSAGREPLLIVRRDLPESIRIRAPHRATRPGRYVIQLEDVEQLRAMSGVVEHGERGEGLELLVPSAWLEPGRYRVQVAPFGEDPIAEFGLEVIE